jgi:hypothetical protein
MGDIHYADATTEAAWITAMEASFGAAKFANLLKNGWMKWAFDNHDWGGNSSNRLSPAKDFVPQGVRRLNGDFDHASAVYSTWVVGRVRYVQTEHWSQRDDMTDAESSAKTFMGAQQKQWWKDTLTAATEPIIVWCCAWPLDNIANGRWASYSTETAELVAWLNARPNIKSKLICVGGDSHDVKLDSGTRTGNIMTGVPSLNASPFNQDSLGFDTTGWDTAYYDPPDGSGVYGVITVTDNTTSIDFKFEAKDQAGVSRGVFNKNFSTPVQAATVSKSKNDQKMDDLILAGYVSGSLADRERKRLLAKAGLVEPQRLSLSDLYRINSERPSVL